MRKTEILLLFDYTYCATGEILRSAERVSHQEFVAPPRVTHRGLRQTLVYTLDVERSWRRRIRGEPPETWGVELAEGDFATVESLAQVWGNDEDEMRAWLNGLDDEALWRAIDLGPKVRFPLSFFLVHILIHTTLQRRDAVSCWRASARRLPRSSSSTTRTPSAEGRAVLGRASCGGTG